MTVDDPRIQLALVELIGHVLLFADLAPDNDIDLDSAVRLQETLAWDLRRLAPDDRDRVNRRFGDLAASRSWDMSAGAADRAATLKQMPEILGLIPRAARDSDDTIGSEPPGPAAISRKLAVVTGAKAHEQARRQAEALRYNRLVGRWEVPTRDDAIRAAGLLREVGALEIGVRIVPFAPGHVTTHRIQPLIEAFFDCFCFAELTPDDLLDPDWATSLEEDMATILGDLPLTLRMELASLIDDIVGSMAATSDSADPERLALLRQIPENIGLLEND